MLKKPKVVIGEQFHSGNFFCPKKMGDIGSGITAAHKTGAFFIKESFLF